MLSCTLIIFEIFLGLLFAISFEFKGLTRINTLKLSFSSELFCRLEKLMLVAD